VNALQAELRTKDDELAAAAKEIMNLQAAVKTQRRGLDILKTSDKRQIDRLEAQVQELEANRKCVPGAGCLAYTLTSTYPACPSLMRLLLYITALMVVCCACRFRRRRPLLPALLVVVLVWMALLLGSRMSCRVPLCRLPCCFPTLAPMRTFGRSQGATVGAAVLSVPSCCRRRSYMRENARTFIAKYDYDPLASSPNIPDGADSAVTAELRFDKGQLLRVYGDVDGDGFLEAESLGLVGLVPINCT